MDSDASWGICCSKEDVGSKIKVKKKTMKSALSMITIMIVFTQVYPRDSLHLIATMTGEKTDDKFRVVAGVGDVNGDGYDDVLVGAPGGNYAKLYFGGSPFDTLADLSFAPESQGFFGYSVAGGGDVNGDGFPDIVIGAPYYTPGPPYYLDSAGKAYVFLGGPQMDTIPDVTMEGTVFRSMLGNSVSFAGDMNKDGYDDIIIGAPFDGTFAQGRAYIYFGGADMDSIADVSIEGQETHDMLGESVSGVGDVNGDGFDDILIGAPQDLKGESGKVYLFLGGHEINFENSKRFVDQSIPQYGSFGRIVARLEDINKDGFSDFGILALDKINIYLGETMIDTIPNLILFPGTNFCYLGGLGDLNKDGFDDFVAVSKYVNIFFGNTFLDTVPDIPLSFWAMPVCGLGDINGDSHIDIGFGRGGGWDPTGKVYIYSYGIGNNVEKKKELNYPENFRLKQNYPNPFNSSTTISYDLSDPYSVRLEIFNCSGQKIKILVSEKQKSGSYNITWNGKDLNDQIVSSGIYFVKMMVETLNMTKKQQVKTQKIVLLR